MKKTLIFISIITSVLFGAFSKVATTSAPFLKIGVGRPTGMGDAFVAIADDASATYWNPAGLGNIQGIQVLLNHIDWIADINHDFISMVFPIKGVGTIGISATVLTMGKFEETTLDDITTPVREDLGTGVTFGAADIALGFSFGKMITDKLSFGTTFKMIHEGIWDVSANGVAMDVGLFYKAGGPGDLRLGVTIANFGPELSYRGRQLQINVYDSVRPDMPIPAEYRTTPAPLPTMFRFGVAYNVINISNRILTLTADIVHPSDINETLNIGAEYNMNNFFFLRGGYILNTDLEYAKEVGFLTGLSCGAGITVRPGIGKELRIDYVYRHIEFLGGSHRVIFNFIF